MDNILLKIYQKAGGMSQFFLFFQYFLLDIYIGIKSFKKHDSDDKTMSRLFIKSFVLFIKYGDSQ